MDPQDLEALRQAKRRLEAVTLATRMSKWVGSPLEKSIELLPERARSTVNQAAHRAIERALDVSIRSLAVGAGALDGEPLDRVHLGLAALSGGVGGFFGLPALLVELPVSTSIMLRAIADIARRHGEDLDDMQARLACVQVFALGGPGSADDAAETSYYAARAVLARTMSEAAKHLASGGAIGKGAPALVRFISQVASRFGVVVSEKVLATAVPAIGALGGAAVNTMFMDHFQEVARGHFTVRRLERRYGAEVVRAEYEKLVTA